MEKNLKTNKERIGELIKQIPRGKVVSYGQVGNVLNINPRVVGFILSGMNSEEMDEYPWQRVVNRDGFISTSKLGEKGVLQERLLLDEGVEVLEFQIIKPETYWFTF